MCKYWNMENIKRPFEISQRILQAHCQSHTNHRLNQSFVKELAKPTHNRQTTKTKEEHRTDNSSYKKLAVQWLNEVQFFNQTFAQVECFVLRNRQLLIAANRCATPLPNWPLTLSWQQKRRQTKIISNNFCILAS